jgi:hypothetical protein
MYLTALEVSRTVWRMPMEPAIAQEGVQCSWQSSSCVTSARTPFVRHWAELFLYGCSGDQCNGQTSVAGVKVVFDGGATTELGVTTNDAAVTPHADGNFLAEFDSSAISASCACLPIQHA